jgi:hypothetical protein
MKACSYLPGGRLDDRGIGNWEAWPGGGEGERRRAKAGAEGQGDGRGCGDAACMMYRLHFIIMNVGVLFLPVHLHVEMIFLRSQH